MLTGTSVTYAVTNHQDGGVLFDPIPGDAIRQMYTIPQVRKRYSYASGMLNCGFPGEEGVVGADFFSPLGGIISQHSLFYNWQSFCALLMCSHLLTGPCICKPQTGSVQSSLRAKLHLKSQCSSPVQILPTKVLK